jgi:hypothetical protein
MGDRRAGKADQRIRFLFALAILSLLSNLVKFARNECLTGRNSPHGRSESTTGTSPARQVPAEDRALDQVLDQEAADAAPPVPKAVSLVSAVAEPALPAAAVVAPVPLAAQDPGTRAPRQVCYRWHSSKLSVESPGHREWPQSGKDSTAVRGNK